MKVFALTVLLISTCCLEGALVKRESEEPPPQVSPEQSLPFAELFQQLQQQAEEFTSMIKNKFGQEQLEGIKNRTETFLQRMQSSFTPLTEQMMQNMAQMFTISAAPKQPAQEGV